jgi:MazG family protein
MNLDEAAKAFREFVAVIKALRTPVTGCPWDLEQTHQTLRPYLVEEAYEVIDAIDRGDDRSFQEELGDLLLQVVLHAQVADDREAFSITEVIRGIADKMVRRHPHVFGSMRVSGSAEVLKNWEQIKAAEKGANDASPAAALARLPESLPALLRAQRLGDKAAKVTADHGTLAETLNEVRALFANLEREVRGPGDVLPAEGGQTLPAALRAGIERQLGDVLFGLCQLARRLGLSAEESLRAANRRYIDRFRQPGQPAREVATPEENP